MAQVVVSTMATLFPQGQCSRVAPGHSGAFAHQTDSGWAVTAFTTCQSMGTHILHI